ncbi:MAG: IclR family transcriptional regulator [Thiolinea sp.]
MAQDNSTQSTMMRGFLIAQKVVEAERPVSSAYLAEMLDLPKATVHRICQQLESDGILQREPDGKRFLGGRRLRKLALATLSNTTLSAARHAILQTLSETVGETCNLTALDGGEIIYLDRVESNWPYRIHLPVGSRLPIHCTATGKLFLAYMKPAQRNRLLNGLHLKAHTAQTITDADALVAELEKIVSDGFGLDNGEYIEGMVSISAPVIDPTGQVNLALAIHAPATRKSLTELRQYLPALRHAAGRVADCEYDLHHP